MSAALQALGALVLAVLVVAAVVALVRSPERCAYCGTPRTAAALDCVSRSITILGYPHHDPHTWPSDLLARPTYDRRPNR